MSNRRVIVERGNADPVKSFLDERLHAFNAQATGFDDSLPLSARITGPEGDVVAALSGHTWGGCCEIASLWVAEDARDQGSSITKVAQAAVRVSDTWFTLRTRSVESVTDEVDDLLTERAIARSMGEVGAHTSEASFASANATSSRAGRR